MSLFKEFKEFAMKGSIIDLAVAVIIGAAFGKIITSFVDNILMPVIGLFIGSNFANLTANVNGVEIKYGLFIQATVDFIIVAFLLFLMIKAMNKMKRKKEVAAAVTPSATEVLLTEIRDLLKRG